MGTAVLHGGGTADQEPREAMRTWGLQALSQRMESLFWEAGSGRGSVGCVPPLR